MKMNRADKIVYSNDKLWLQVTDAVKVIVGYIILFFIWQFSLSFQSSLYTLMYFCSLAMVVMAVFTAVKCPEERISIIKAFRLSFALYVVVIFVYDLVLQIAIMDKINSVSTPDAALITTGNLLTSLSCMLKFSGPVAFIVYCIKTIGVFKNGISRSKKKSQLRDVRQSNVAPRSERFDYNDRF